MQSRTSTTRPRSRTTSISPKTGRFYVHSRAGIRATSTGGWIWDRRVSRMRGVLAHRRLGRSEGLGEVRLREDARIPLGHSARAARGRPENSVRPPFWRAGLAGYSGRISRHAAPSRRHPGRHRTGLRRAATLPRQDRTIALRHAQRVSGQRRGRTSPMGDGLHPAKIFRPRRPRGSGRAVAAPLRRRR